MCEEETRLVGRVGLRVRLGDRVAVDFGPDLDHAVGEDGGSRCTERDRVADLGRAEVLIVAEEVAGGERVDERVGDIAAQHELRIGANVPVAGALLLLAGREPEVSREGERVGILL